MSYWFSDIEWPTSAEIHNSSLNAGAKVVGTSTQGRPISALRVGSGKRTLFAVAGVHGAERVNPAAVQRLLTELAEQPELHADWLSHVSLVLIPLLNPDGYEEIRRGNVATWQETVEQGLGDTADDAGRENPPRHFYNGPVIYDGVDYSERTGFDIARDLPHTTETFTPDGTPRWGFTREAHVLKNEFDRTQRDAEWLAFLDLHSQRNGYTPLDSDELVQWSTVIAAGTPEAEQTASAIIGGTIAQLRNARPGLAVSKYPRFPGSPNPAVPSILSEVSGLPQEPVSFALPDQIQLSYDILTATIRVVAGLYPENAESYNTTPHTNREISRQGVWKGSGL